MPFNYRSTNATGYTHHGGALVVGAELGSGIELNPTSSGNAPNIMPAGDEANKGITIQSKGTGTITIGSSVNQPVVITSTNVRFGASTSPLGLIQQYYVEWTVPALSSAASAESTVTVIGLTTASHLLFTPSQKVNSTVTGVITSVRCSTADELVIITSNVSVSSLSGSTQSGRLLQIGF